MKKQYFIFLATLFSLGLNAQTLTQANHAPVVGDMFATKQCDSTGVNPGASGAGAVWTYSAIVVHPAPVKSYTAVAVASTGSASAYPSAGVAVKTATGNVFYSSSVNDLKYYGGDEFLAGSLITFTYSGTGACVAKYPMTLGTTTTSLINGNISLGGFGGTFTGNSAATANATGTLNLPGASFSNVIRVLTIKNTTLTTIATVTVNTAQYDYYHATSKAPLFSITSNSVISMLGTNTETIVTISSNYLTVGMNSSANDLINLAVFPNPADENITLSFYNANGDNSAYEIVNVLGQSIKKEMLSNDKGIVRQNINIETLPSGIYFVKIIVGNNVSIQKITVQ